MSMSKQIYNKTEEYVGIVYQLIISPMDNKSLPKFLEFYWEDQFNLMMYMSYFVSEFPNPEIIHEKLSKIVKVVYYLEVNNFISFAEWLELGRPTNYNNSNRLPIMHHMFVYCLDCCYKKLNSSLSLTKDKYFGYLNYLVYLRTLPHVKEDIIEINNIKNEIVTNDNVISSVYTINFYCQFEHKFTYDYWEKNIYNRKILY